MKIAIPSPFREVFSSPIREALLTATPTAVNPAPQPFALSAGTARTAFTKSSAADKPSLDVGRTPPSAPPFPYSTIPKALDGGVTAIRQSTVLIIGNTADGKGSGSGVIIGRYENKLLILTNAHVPSGSIDEGGVGDSSPIYSLPGVPGISIMLPGGQRISPKAVKLLATSSAEARNEDKSIPDLALLEVQLPPGSPSYAALPIASGDPQRGQLFVTGGYVPLQFARNETTYTLVGGAGVVLRNRPGGWFAPPPLAGSYGNFAGMKYSAGRNKWDGAFVPGTSGGPMVVISGNRWVLGGIHGRAIREDGNLTTNKQSIAVQDLFPDDPLQYERTGGQIGANTIKAWLIKNLPARYHEQGWLPRS